ncbi:T9SS type A sorting domain-containing protein [uncultured Polaribacter sp.]|uniref:T9SS type A sorting domain-containing protein n=1 Tax=uncultured Polaribacter sp. TaxID=174711 RepID=UPI0026300DCB|nr:T9SS type A sorting domain-containing protein [uncultured Polaribacter sp.]
MTKKITPNFLRHVLVLIIFSQSLNFFSQNNVYLEVNWPSYSGENKMEIINSSNVTVLSIENSYGNGANTSFLNKTSTTTSLPSGNYTVRVYDNYGDDWNGTSPFGKVFIDGSEAFNFNGDFLNNGPAEVEITSDFSITIGLDNASFAYSKTTYCPAESDPTPIITGESGGTFTATNGLSIDNSSGKIDLSSSTIGEYIVTYTTLAPDQNSATKNITIGDETSLTYETSRVNKNDVDLYPTTTGVSGTFSASTGLSINSATGVIDVSASTVGTYTVSYTTSGSCGSVYTDTVTIIDTVFPGISQYQEDSKKYIEYIPGTMPIIISAPHGGRLTPNNGEIPDRTCGTNAMDDNTDVLIKEIQKKCFDQFGVYPYIIINNLHRKKLDPNRNESVATCGNATAKVYYDAFHNFIDAASADINSKFGKGLYIDLHGQSHTVPRIEAGYNLTSSSFDEDLNNTSTNTTELARVTIKNLINNNISGATFEDLIRGATSFGGIMQSTGGKKYADLGYAGCGRTEGYRTVPSNIGDGGQGSCDDTNPGSNSYFAGDFYNNIRHGSGNTTTANTVVEGGGTVNGGGGTIDGIMTEVNRRVRDLGSIFSSTYGVSDSRSPTIPFFSRDYAKVIEKFIDLHYNDFSKISYSEDNYSIYDSDATPTIAGISGGTFSSTSGLSINTATGVIDLSSSTPGVYTIAYNAPNVGSYYKKEIQITIHTNAVTNEFISNSGNWSVPANWSLNRIPAVLDNVSIPIGKIANLDLTAVVVNDIDVVGSLTIIDNKSLTVNGNLTNTGSFTLNSSSSIIVKGTSSGKLTYKRSLNANTWYLIGAPFSGQNVADFVISHPNLAKGNGTGNDKNVALANFDNSKTLASEKWQYYKVGQVDGIGGDDTTDNMTSGLGYISRLTTSGDISFTGTLQTADVPTTVTQNVNSFNLVSNPYPSYISSADFLTENTGVGKSLKSQTLWVWDPSLNGGTGDYDTRITIEDFQIAPGQAFFVNVDNNLGINFSKTSQSHQNTDTFLKSSRTEIKLNVTDTSNSKSTKIYYIEGTTTGFDDGYDGEIFGGVPSDFQIFTELVSNATSKKLSIQSIPNDNHEAMVIPIGINAKAGSEITFTSQNKNIPSGLHVYLEDKANKAFTKLNEISDTYKVVLTSDLNGVGNFFIHTRSSVLSLENESSNSNTIFNNDKNELIITGVVDQKIKIELFTILGKKVFSTVFSSDGNSKIQLPKLSTGVYFSKLKSGTIEINKKIILK